MKVWDLIKPIWSWLALGLVIGLVFLGYACEHRRALNAENHSQQLEGQIQVKVEEANEAKTKAEAADIKVVALAKANLEAEQKTLFEHSQSEALKRKLASLLASKPLDPLPSTPSDDPVVLRDQIISQQENEIQSQQVEIKGLKEENGQLHIEVDSYKQSSDAFEASLKLSEQRVRAEEIAKDAMKRSGMVREVKGGLEGAALTVLLHVLKVI
jgi:hypothetical protein